MTTLRTAAQQALEALRCVDLQSLVPDYGSGHYSVARLDGPQVKSAITAMEAALAEEALQRLTDVQQEIEAALAEPQPNTLHGWVFKRNADGSVGIFAPPPKPGESRRTSDCVGTNQRDLNELLGKLADHMAEPVQEPAGWFEGPFGEFRANQLFKHSWPAQTVAWSIPLYLAPPQRLPLTEEEIWALYYALPSDDFARSDRIDFARAVERAHGIK